MDRLLFRSMAHGHFDLCLKLLRLYYFPQQYYHRFLDRKSCQSNDRHRTLHWLYRQHQTLLSRLPVGLDQQLQFIIKWCLILVTYFKLVAFYFTWIKCVCCIRRGCWFNVDGGRSLIKELNGWVFWNQWDKTAIRNTVHHLILCSLRVGCTQNNSYRPRNFLVIF